MVEGSENFEAVVITIDGPSGVGKSTVARLLARRLGFLFLDTGATYRALAYSALREGLDPEKDVEALARLAREFPMQLVPDADTGCRVVLDGQDISAEIRSETVGEAASQLAQHAPVRAALVERQRQIAAQNNAVAEGRDTGSVVFPKARYKFFLEADNEVRALRRQKELRERFGVEEALDVLKEQIAKRDERDESREASPLIKAENAIVINTDGMTPEDNVKAILDWVQV